MYARKEIELRILTLFLTWKGATLQWHGAELPFSHFTSWRLKIQGVQPCQFSLGPVVDNNQGCYDPNYISEPQQTTFKLCFVCELMRYAATPKLQNSFVVTIGAPGAYVPRPTWRPWCVLHTYNMLERFDGFVFYNKTIFKVSLTYNTLLSSSYNSMLSSGPNVARPCHGRAPSLISASKFSGSMDIFAIAVRS